MLKIKNGKLTYNSQYPVHALNNVSLSVDKGEWVTILGPSGSGKTTLLNVISGIEKLSHGDITVNGQVLQNLSSESLQTFRRDTIGYIYQDFRLLNQYSVLENVMLPQWPYKSRKEIEKKSLGLLEELNMGHRIHHLPGELSGGEKQRTSIARALLNDPEILLCDEPTGNLDAENRENIMSILKQLQQEGMTIILVTHDNEVARYGDWEIHMRDGALQNKVMV